MLFKKSLNLKIESQIKDTQGRFIVIDLEIEGKILALANIICSEQNDLKFFDSLFSAVNNVSSWPDNRRWLEFGFR